MPSNLHSYSKEQREAVRQLLHLVLIRDMGSFTADGFKHWIKDMDAKFRKVGLTLGFRISERAVDFSVKEVRTGRAVYQFQASTRVRFDDRDVVMAVEDISWKSR